MTKHRLKPKNKCKICHVPTTTEGVCKGCTKALSGATMTLKEIGIPEDHKLWVEYFQAFFAHIGERRKTIKTLFKEVISYQSLSAFELDDATRGKRDKPYYIRFMSPDNAIKAYWFDDHGELPSELEINKIKARADYKKNGDAR